MPGYTTPCKPRHQDRAIPPLRNLNCHHPVKPPDSENLHLDDELLIVRHSGEIPEVALHGAIFFLTRDQEGPGIELGPEELKQLKKMVVKRYLEIIHRDLDPANRDKTIYRGLARCRCNWQRLQRFCQREGFAHDSFRQDTATALTAFLQRELLDIASGQRTSSVNCTALELAAFIEELGVNCAELPEGWCDICLTGCRL